MIDKVLGVFENTLGFRTLFWHRHPGMSSKYGTTSSTVNNLLVGYRLGIEKGQASKVFADDFNRRDVRLSLALPIADLKILSDQLAKYRVEGKPADGSNNDAAIATIMAYYIMLNDKNATMKKFVTSL
jgi:hypothetical protein